MLIGNSTQVLGGVALGIVFSACGVSGSGKKSLIRANSRPDLHQRGNYAGVEDDAQLRHQLLCHPWHGDCLYPWKGDKAEVDGE